MTEPYTDKDFDNFRNHFDSLAILDSVVKFAGKNLKPDQVFDEKELIEWAKTLHPSEIYGDDGLSKWASDWDYALVDKS